jgi:hypothetical protein
VFEGIRKPWFVYGDKDLIRRVGKQSNPPGEDVYFSLKVRKFSFDLYVDCRSPLLHYVPRFVGPPALVQSFIEGGTLTDAFTKFRQGLEDRKVMKMIA